MAQLTRYGGRGAIMLKQTSGTGTGTQWVLPAASALPVNPRNTEYPMVIVPEGSKTNAVLSKYTPSIVVRAYAKASFLTAGLFNVLLNTLDSDNYSCSFAVAAYNADDGTTRVYDGSRCAGITLAGNAFGGPIGVEMAFLARYGESQAPSPTSFTAPTNAQIAGYLTDVSQVDWNGTATSVGAWTLTMTRAQEYGAVYDSTLFMTTVMSGARGGVMQLTQMTSASVVPSTAATLKLGTAGSGLQIALTLDPNNFSEPVSPAFLTDTNTYSLVDLTGGGTPFVFTSF